MDGATGVMGGLLLGAYGVVLGLLSILGLHRWHLLGLARRGAAHGAPSGTPPSLLTRAGGGEPPLVTVQLPIYNERFVACRLLKAVCRLDHPRDRLQIQILDDSTDDTSRRLGRLARRARRLGFHIEHLRRPARAGFKAGALAEGLQRARGEYIALFDADFIPAPDFLRRALPAFDDPQVGMVQARWGHVNRRASLLTRVQAALLDGHFLVEHLARARAGRFFNFNGTAGVWRRRCIESAGGWQARTLTEDLDLSYRAQLAAWRFVFLPDLVAPAELPARMGAFRSQQYRWAKGSMQTARLLLGPVLASRLPWRIRLEACFHLTGNAAYLLLLALCLLMWPAIRLRHPSGGPTALTLDAAVLAAATLSVAAFFHHGQRRAGRGRLESLLCLPPLLGIGAGLAVNNARAVVDALRGRDSPFVRTPKDGGRDGGGARQRPERTAAAGGYGPAGARPWAEGTLALYLVAALVDSAWLGAWPWVPWLALFAWGFGYTAWRGAREGVEAHRHAATARAGEPPRNRT